MLCIKIQSMTHETPRLIYLASPYSHPDPTVRNARYHAACVTTAALIQRGYPVFSPIVHSHVLHTEHGLGGSWETWAKIDRALIGASSDVWVLCLDGWRESRGVKAEIEQARAEGLGLALIDEKGDFVQDVWGV